MDRGPSSSPGVVSEGHQWSWGCPEHVDHRTRNQAVPSSAKPWLSDEPVPWFSVSSPVKWGVEIVSVQTWFMSETPRPVLVLCFLSASFPSPKRLSFPSRQGLSLVRWCHCVPGDGEAPRGRVWSHCSVSVSAPRRSDWEPRAWDSASWKPEAMPEPWENEGTNWETPFKIMTREPMGRAFASPGGGLWFLSHLLPTPHPMPPTSTSFPVWHLWAI